MTAIWRDKISKSARWARRFAVLALSLTIISSLAHRYALIGTEHFLATVLFIAGLALLALILSLFAFWRFWRFGDHVGGNLLASFLCLGLLGMPIIWMGARTLTSPPINDVSTDLTDPPAIQPLGKNQYIPATRIALSPSDQQAASRIPTTRIYLLDAEKVEAIADALLKERGWKIERVLGADDQEEGRIIQAEAFSYLLRYPCDIALRIRSDDERTYVDMRSASRFGRHDFGDNLMRIDRFFADLDERVELAESAVPSQTAR